jgi:GntR family transcriptional regulator
MSIGLARINRNTPVPLYHQIKCALLESIKHGRWEAGHQLPNEATLAQNFGVSKITVRQALQELASMGYVRREQGRGTFISKPKLDKGPRELTSFTEEMRQHRLRASSRVISTGIVKADVRLAERLDLRVGHSVFVLKRLRLANDEPMGIQTTHLPVALVPGLTAEQVKNGSLYEVLATRYGLAPHKARETYFSVSADPATAALLDIDADAAVFAVERVTLLANGRPFEFAQSIMRGDRYSIILDLTANVAAQATAEEPSR